MGYDIKITETNETKLENLDFDNIPFGSVFTDHMFVVDYKDGEWQSPSIQPFNNMTIHPATMALHYGQSIFEGMKASITQEGQPMLFRPEEHVLRLNNSARRMCMPEIPGELFLEGLRKLTWLEKDWIPPRDGSALYLRPFMFATDGHIGVAPSKSYRFMIIALPVGPYYEKAVSLLAEKKYVRAVKGGVGEAKTCGNYAASLLPAQRAKAKGYDQVLWLDAHEFKYIQEVGTMNIFFVLKDKVITPATEGAILKGITRKTILDILNKENYLVEERKISIDEIVEYYKKGDLVEVFGSGTAAVIANVNKVANGDFIMEFDKSNWNLSQWLKRRINGLRNGTIHDTYGWTVPITEEAPSSTSL